jgi:hypothetical protein
MTTTAHHTTMPNFQISSFTNTPYKMEKMMFYENDEHDKDLKRSVLSESRPSPNPSAADIFYAMMNGEPLLEDASIMTATEDADEQTSPVDVSSRSKPSSSSSLSLSPKKRTKKSKSHPRRHHSNSSPTPTPTTGFSPPTTVSMTLLEHPEEEEDDDDIFMDDDDDLSLSPSSRWCNSGGQPQKNNHSRSSSSSKPKKDSSSSSSVFYQFAHKVRTQFELREKAERFQECVDLRDRTKNLVAYRQCFIGSEAVDAMLYGELASTREEAVELGRKLASELNLFRHVRGRHMFKDEDLYYHYRTTNQRDSAATVSTVSAHLSVISSSTRADTERLTTMSHAFRQCVQARDRRYRLKTFKQCFVGSEAVDVLVHTRLVATRKDAVEFGRTLMRKLNLFQHVTGDHAFSDEYLFFRFCDTGPANRRLLPMPLAAL